jgi:Tfp pilus assembly protein PilF
VYKRQDQQRAIDCYRQALSGKLTPENASVAHVNLAVAEWQQGDFERAKANLDKAVAADPRNVAGYTHRAALHDRLGNHQEALEDCNTALVVDPNDGYAYFLRARAFRSLGQPKRALRDISWAVKLKPQELPQALNEMAWLLATTPDDSVRDGRRAVEAAEQACALTKWQSGSYLDTLAAAQAEKGDFGQAVISQARALALVEEIDPARAGMEERLQLYRAQKPFRSGPSTVVTAAAGPAR